MIIFRVDGNSKIGSGHVMRCLSLADAASEQGTSCRFVMSGTESQELIQGRGYPCAVLRTDYADMESELPAFTKILSDEKPDAIIVDSYHVTSNYLQALRPFGKLIYIDDLAAFAYPVDVLVNYGLGAKGAYSTLYEGRQVPIMLLGLEYAPLRREFQGLPFKAPQETVKNIFVSTGGSDPEHIAVRLLNALKLREDMARYQFHFVIGPMNPDREKITALAQTIPNVSIHQDVMNMQDLMSSCDVAVSAGGSTIFELCACGLPMIVYSLADNQAGIKKLAEKGFALFAGDARGNEDFVTSVFNLLDSLCEDYGRRKTMAKEVYHLMDGCGARRVIQAILQEEGEYWLGDYSMRPIEEGDLCQILDWRNHDDIHAMMLTDHKITWEEHYRWFKKIEDNLPKRHFVFAYRGRPVGYIAYNDFDDQSKTCAPGVYLGDKEGLPAEAGTCLFYICFKYAFDELGVERLKGSVLAKNNGAIAINRFLGAHEIEEESRYVEKSGKRELAKCLEVTKASWQERCKRLHYLFGDSMRVER